MVLPDVGLVCRSILEQVKGFADPKLDIETVAKAQVTMRATEVARTGEKDKVQDELRRMSTSLVLHLIELTLCAQCYRNS